MKERVGCVTVEAPETLASPSATSMATEEITKPSSLPPYPEMIMKAIEAVGDSNGANKSAISNYIESTYGDVPAGHSTLLTDHLNRMKDSGEIVFSKNNYMKPDPNAPPKRGRGRPPKPKDLNVVPPPQGDEDDADVAVAAAAPAAVAAAPLGPPRPRGRPPKDPNAPPKSPKASSGRPRGRPKKIARTDVASTPGSTGRPRGRPPKVKPQMTEVSVEQ